MEHGGRVGPCMQCIKSNVMCPKGSQVKVSIPEVIVSEIETSAGTHTHTQVHIFKSDCVEHTVKRYLFKYVVSYCLDLCLRFAS